MCTEMAGTDWVVLLEAADHGAAPLIDARSFDRLVTWWASPAPTCLYSPSRYALQISVCAADAPSALSKAMRLWEEGLRAAGLPMWELVRAEVLTPDELDFELDAARPAIDAPAALPQGATPSQQVIENSLLRRALHDSVTGLPHREVFLDQVRQTLASRRDKTTVQAVMVISVDIRDSVGAVTASPPPDDVVLMIAGRLLVVVRRADTIGRVGVAEFAVLLEAASAEAVDGVAGRIVGASRWRLDFEHYPPVTASVGVAIAERDEDADDLIARAEAAALSARRAGGDCYRQFAVSGEA